MKTHTGLCILVSACWISAGLLAGCATVSEDAYPGNPRPPEEIARVSLPTFFTCTRVDGVRIKDPWWVNLLPGEHSLKVKLYRKSRNWRYGGDPVTLPFIVEAGHTYRMKICFFYVDSKDEIYDPHYYYVRKLGGSEEAARHALSLLGPDGWVYLDWLPEPLGVVLSWTPYMVDEADGSLVPHPDPKVTKAVEDLLTLVKQQREDVWSDKE